MNDFWCYVAFIFGLFGFFFAMTDLSSGMVLLFSIISLFGIVMSLSTQFQSTEKTSIAFILSGLAFLLSICGSYSSLTASGRSSKSKYEQTHILMDKLSKAIGTYKLERGQFPPWAKDIFNVNYCRIPENSGYQILPSFHVWTQDREGGRSYLLTTPVAFISEFPIDPYMETVKATFVYYNDGGGWILISPGPDANYDINPQSDYNSSVVQPSPLLKNKRYDPTNGVNSIGDIFKVK